MLLLVRSILFVAILMLLPRGSYARCTVSARVATPSITDEVTDDSLSTSISDQDAPSSTPVAVTTNTAEKTTFAGAAAATTTIAAGSTKTTKTSSTDTTAAASSATETSDVGTLVKSSTTDYGSLSGTLKGIGSWYRADNDQDSTNGRGWCEFDYNDSTPCIAPYLTYMLNSAGGDSKKAKEKFCGMQVNVTVLATDWDSTAPVGRSKLFYILDSYPGPNHPTDVDLMHGAWEELADYETSDKNMVLTVNWELTGYQAEKWVYSK